MNAAANPREVRKMRTETWLLFISLRCLAGCQERDFLVPFLANPRDFYKCGKFSLADTRCYFRINCASKQVLWLHEEEDHILFLLAGLPGDWPEGVFSSRQPHGSLKIPRELFPLLHVC